LVLRRSTDCWQSAECRCEQPPARRRQCEAANELSAKSGTGIAVIEYSACSIGAWNERHLCVTFAPMSLWGSGFSTTPGHDIDHGPVRGIGRPARTPLHGPAALGGDREILPQPTDWSCRRRSGRARGWRGSAGPSAIAGPGSPGGRSDSGFIVVLCGIQLSGTQ
jgi:hypothetical protein